MHLAQGRVQLRAVVNTEMNLRGSWGGGGRFLDQLSGYQLLQATLLHGVRSLNGE
jgi:hypothetical protein